LRLRRKVSSTTDSGLGTGQIVWNDLDHVGGHDIWYSGTATCYGLGGPGIEFRKGGGGGEIFPHFNRPYLGLTQPPIQSSRGAFPGVKRPGRGVDHPTLCNAEVKKRVGMYLYSRCVSSWPVLG